jgi:TolB-like protein
MTRSPHRVPTPGRFIEELRRRKVTRAATMYLGAAWMTLKAAETVLPRVGFPDWTITLVLALMALGFPLAMVMSWMFDVTPEGVKRAESIPADEPTEAGAGLYLSFAIIAVLLAVVSYLYVERLALIESAGDSGRAARIDDAKPSVAVLAFVNMSGDADNDYFSEGISEEILNELVKQSDLKVIARTSSFAFKGENRDIREIGEVLDVSHVLEGSVRKAGNRVRVTAQLIEAEGGSHLWSETYDRELENVFLVQDEIADRILRALKVHLAEPGGETKAIDPEAYNHYLLGNYLSNRFQLDAAIEEYRRAIARDSTFAAAYGALSRAHHLRVFYEIAPVAAELSHIQTNYERALLLDPDQPEALSVRATKRFFVDRDYQSALDEFHAHVSRSPSSVALLSNYRNPLAALGRVDKTVELAERIVELDPLSPFSHLQYLMQLEDGGRLEDATRAFERMRQLGQDSFPGEGATLFGRLDDPEQRARWNDALVRLVGDSSALYLEFAAYHHFAAGERQAAREFADRALAAGAGRRSGRIEANLLWIRGDTEAALARLRRAMADREYRALVELRSFRSLAERADPGAGRAFEPILREIGLDDERVAGLRLESLPF